MIKRNILSLIFCLFLFACFNLHAQLTESAIKDLRKSTVRVKSGSKVSTGFLWKNNDWVVTTLHSIEQSNNIQITLVDQVRNAHVVRVLKRYDLALLKLDSPVTLPIINNSNDKPIINSNLYVLGYNGKGNLSTIIDRSLRLGFNSSGKLKGLLSNELRISLSNCKSPDPEIDILYFDGSLLPGFSGSPIVNNAGHLVGIADGGLEEGAQSISWGIGAQFLNQLSASQEKFQNTYCASNSQSVKFASENIQDENVEYITFNDYKFIKTKTRTINQMITTVDDPLGLNQLINGYSMTNNLNYLEFSYDIYTDFKSGATLCVPEGTKLKVHNGILVGQTLNSNFAYIAWPSRTPNAFASSEAHQKASITFEKKVIEYSNMNLVYNLDPKFSYTSPVYKLNGTIVNRRAFRGYYQDQFGNYYPQTFIFETHIASGDTYLGMAVINLNSTQNMQNLLNKCAYSGQCYGKSIDADCQYICQNYKSFSQIVLGVHMGGFSNTIYSQN